MGRAGRGAAHPARRRDQRGNALVEAVIILPVLMLLTFGGIELGIGFGQKGALESATRAGARRASTETAAADPTGIGDETLPAVNAALDSTAVPKLDGLWIYDASLGDPGDGIGCSHANCIYYGTDSLGQHFVTPGLGNWLESTRDACGPNPTQVSVKIKGTFSFLTNLVGSGDVALHSVTTLQLEPTTCSS